MQMMKPGKLTVLDVIVALVGLGIVAVVAYRYAAQRYLDLYSVLVFIVALAGYLTYRAKGQK